MQRTGFLVLISLVLGLAAGPALAAGGVQGGFAPRLIARDSAPRLAVLERVAVKQASKHSVLRGVPPASLFGASPFGPAPSSLVQTAAAAAMPAPSVSFEGLDQTQQEAASGAASVPPDTDGDVGPNHYVQIVNTAIAIYNKSGTLLFGPVATHTLWAGMTNACATHDDGDGIVLYDRFADRWVITQFALPPNPETPTKTLQCMAVSKTGDPVSGGWYRYVINEGAVFGDYPKLGIYRNGYYLSANLYSLSSGAFLGGGLFVMDRSRMLDPTLGAPRKPNTVRVPNVYGLIPADVDGPTPPAAGRPGYYAAPLDLSTGDRILLVKVTPNFTTGTPAMTKVRVPAGSFSLNLCNFGSNFACIPEPSPGERLDGLSGGQTMYRLVYLNQGGTEKLLITFSVKTASGLAGERWAELRNSPTGWAVFQQQTFAPADGQNRWLGSIAMDKHSDIALGYSVSSATLAPSIRYAGRLAADPPGKLSQGEGTLQAGTGVQRNGANRWGDYSAMSIDPSDDCTFWYTNEYYPATTSFPLWHTRVGAFRFPSCT